MECEQGSFAFLQIYAQNLFITKPIVIVLITTKSIERDGILYVDECAPSMSMDVDIYMVNVGCAIGNTIVVS